MTLAEVVREAYDLAEGRRDWTEAFDVAMQNGGATYVGGSVPCNCPEDGDRGHLPECGWALKEVAV